MLNFITIFVSGYVSVFLLGFQSRLVNTGNYWGAAACSFSIAMFQATLWTNLMRHDATWTGTLAYGLAGASAITSAIFAHKKLFPKAI